MIKLHQQILQLEKHISCFEKINQKVSNSTIGWQIDHCLLVINGVISQLEISNPTKCKPRWNFNKVFVFTTRKIPRGKIRAPKLVTPVSVASKEELLSKIELAKSNILKFSTLPKNAFFTHPFFKDLNVKQTEKFLEIHTQHHLKIIEDILR